MQAIVTQAGITRIRDVLAGTVPQILVLKYRIGSAVDVPLNDGAVTNVVNLTNAGTSGQPGNGIITAVPKGGDTVVLTLSLSDQIGDFVIGNLMLLLDDGTPFLFASLFTPPADAGGAALNPQFTKVRRRGTDSLGNFFRANFTIKVTNVAQILNVTVYADAGMGLCETMHAQNQYALPDAGDTIDTVIVDSFAVRANQPMLGYRPTGEANFYAAPITQRIDDLRFGVIGGGMDGLPLQDYDICLDFGTIRERKLDVRTVGQTYANMDFQGGEVTDPINASDYRFRIGTLGTGYDPGTGRRELADLFAYNPTYTATTA